MSDLLRLSDVCAVLQCGETTALSLLRGGQLRGSKIGGKWLVQPSAVDEYVDATSNRPRRRRKRAM